MLQNGASSEKDPTTGQLCSELRFRASSLLRCSTCVEDVPFLGTFEDGAALAFDLRPGGSVNEKEAVQGAAPSQ